MRVQITFEMDLPVDVENIDDTQLREWAGFYCGALGGIKSDNPLVDCELNASLGSVDVRLY